MSYWTKPIRTARVTVKGLRACTGYSVSLSFLAMMLSIIALASDRASSSIADQLLLWLCCFGTTYFVFATQWLRYRTLMSEVKEATPLLVAANVCIVLPWIGVIFSTAEEVIQQIERRLGPALRKLGLCPAGLPAMLRRNLSGRQNNRSGSGRDSPPGGVFPDHTSRSASDSASVRSLGTAGAGMRGVLTDVTEAYCMAVAAMPSRAMRFMTATRISMGIIAGTHLSGAATAICGALAERTEISVPAALMGSTTVETREVFLRAACPAWVEGSTAVAAVVFMVAAATDDDRPSRGPAN